jgi:hypothetical protein
LPRAGYRFTRVCFLAGYQATAIATAFFTFNTMETQMHIGSVLVAIWLVIGGIAAGQRGDFTGSFGCSSAGTIAVTILAGPLNYTGVNPNIKCTVRHPSN